MAETRTRDWTDEDLYWRDAWKSRPYVDPTYSYDDYQPAYRYAVDSYGTYEGRSWDDAESDLSKGWEKFKGKSKLQWEHAKGAVKDAWHRMTD